MQEPSFNHNRLVRAVAEALSALPGARSAPPVKRDAQAKKDLASELLELTKSQLGKVPLDEDIRLAIEQARAFRSHGARRRQLLYVAKLIRRTDPLPIIEALDGFHSEALALTGRHHRSEAWRDFLLQ